VFPGLQEFMYNRGDRFDYFLNKHQGIFTWQDVLDYKYDKKYHSDKTYMKNFKIFYQLDETKYPKLASVIQILKNWDLNGDFNSNGATVSLLTSYYLSKKNKTSMGLMMLVKEPISEQDAVESLFFAKEFLKKHFGTVHVPLHKIQRHIRGNVNLSVEGLSEVPRAIDVKLFDADKGIFKAKSGDGYIQFVKFNKTGVTSIETIHAYGASSRKDSPHYTDQMQMFVNQETKTMSLDKKQIYNEAKMIYTPSQMAKNKALWYQVKQK
jgi:acyl-homoserine-lactone acylase